MPQNVFSKGLLASCVLGIVLPFVALFIFEGFSISATLAVLRHIIQGSGPGTQSPVRVVGGSLTVCSKKGFANHSPGELDLHSVDASSFALENVSQSANGQPTKLVSYSINPGQSWSVTEIVNDPGEERGLLVNGKAGQVPANGTVSFTLIYTGQSYPDSFNASGANYYYTNGAKGQPNHCAGGEKCEKVREIIVKIGGNEPDTWYCPDSQTGKCHLDIGLTP